MVRAYFGREECSVGPWTIELRSWHTRCLSELLSKMNEGQRSLAVAAVMGAGKTMLSLRWLQLLLQRRHVRIGIVVVPTDNLRLQFCRDAKYVGLRAYAITSTPDQHKDHSKRVSCIPALDGPIPPDAHIIVLTYAQIAKEANIRALRAICDEVQTAWVFDEVHHSGDGRSDDDPALLWAEGMERAAENAAYRLLTTATPNRTDGRPIPFVRYDERKIPIFDFIYSYQDALEDGYVRVVEFILMNGLAHWWTTKDGDLKARLTDKIPQAHWSKRLLTIVSPTHEWVSQSLDAGVELIRDMRRQGRHKDAGGLAVARSKTEAYQIAKQLEEKGAKGVVVVTYDDPDASAKIDAFRESQDEWIVAVRMVSEGIDMKRLRVIVYCTNITTELLFLQILGRVLRYISTPKISPQVAHIIIPPDPRLMRVVESYRSIVMRALKEKGGGDGPGIQESLWYSVGANGFADGRVYGADGIDQHWINEAGQYSAGNSDVQILIAMALRDQSPEKDVPQKDTGLIHSPSSRSWDAEKHEVHDEIKSARTKLTSTRINSGRYETKAIAAQSVNSDLWNKFGPIAAIRNDLDKCKAYRDYLRQLITNEEANVSV